MNTHYGEILYEDSDLWVVRKRAGVAVEENGVRRDLYTELKAERLQKNEEPQVYLVHRLDRNVEGVLVFAKTKDAARVLSEELQSHTLKKEYLAVVCGAMEPHEGELRNHLGKQGRVAFVEPVEREWTKEAVLSYRTIATSDNVSLLHIDLETGRFHQIRVQLSHAGSPILGDRKYGKSPFSESVPYPALCAFRLSFLHPRTNESLSFRITPEGAAFLPFLPSLAKL